MTTITVHDQVLRVSFPGWERWLVNRVSVTIPMSEITAVEVLPGWSTEILGWRSGVVVSGLLKLGTFTHPSGCHRLVAMRRGRPLLRIRLRDHEFDELLISDAEASVTAARIHARSAA